MNKTMDEGCGMTLRKLFLCLIILGSLIMVLISPGLQILTHVVGHHVPLDAMDTLPTKKPELATTMQTINVEELDTVSSSSLPLNLSDYTIQNKFNKYKCYNNNVTNITDLHICGRISPLLHQNIVFFTSTYYSKDMYKLRNVAHVWASMRPTITPVLFLTDNRIYEKQR